MFASDMPVSEKAAELQRLQALQAQRLMAPLYEDSSTGRLSRRHRPSAQSATLRAAQAHDLEQRLPNLNRMIEDGVCP